MFRVNRQISGSVLFCAAGNHLEIHPLGIRLANFLAKCISSVWRILPAATTTAVSYTHLTLPTKA